MSLKIRAALEEDAEAIAKLSKQLGYPLITDEVQFRLRKILQLKSHHLIVAEVDGTAAAWAHVNEPPPSLLSESRAELVALVVDEQLRGRGIGKALLRSAEEWARRCGFDLIRLRSNLKREQAHRFYLREGYTLEKSSHLFTKQL